MTIVAQSALWLNTSRKYNKSITPVADKNNTNGAISSQKHIIERICSEQGTRSNDNHGGDNDDTLLEPTSASSKSNTKKIFLDVVLNAIQVLSPHTYFTTASTMEPILSQFRKAALVATKLNLLGLKREITCREDLARPLLSTFSTHHGRLSSVAILDNYCRVSLSSIQKSSSSNGPSIFTGFSFVDETLLMANKTNQLRFYLIDFNERKHTEALEHVAADVQFYNGKRTPTDDVEEDTHEEDPSGVDGLQLNNNKHIHENLERILEMNMWTSKLLESSRKQINPSAKLLGYIGATNRAAVAREGQESVGNVMIPCINIILGRLTRDPHGCLTVDKTGRIDALCIDHNLSKIKIKSNAIGRAMVYVYYKALESMLDYETARLKTTAHVDLLLSHTFHRSILSICLICVVHGTSGPIFNSKSNKTSSSYSHTFIESIFDLVDCTGYEYMKISESFVQSMEYRSTSTNNIIFRLPIALQRKIKDTEEHILESILWMKKQNIESSRTACSVLDSLIHTENDQTAQFWPPKVLGLIQEGVTFDDDVKIQLAEVKASDLKSEIQFVDYLFTKLIQLSSKRVGILCENLLLSLDSKRENEQQININETKRRVCSVILHLLRKQTHLLYDHHIDQLILCTLYGVTKVMKHLPEISYSKIIDIYSVSFKERLGKESKHLILKDVMLQKNKIGNIIEFYNQMYMPSMKKYLLQSKKCSPFTKKAQTKKRSSIEEVSISSSSKRNKTIAGAAQSFNLQIRVNNCTERKKDSPKTRILYSFGDASSKKVRIFLYDYYMFSKLISLVRYFLHRILI